VVDEEASPERCADIASKQRGPAVPFDMGRRADAEWDALIARSAFREIGSELGLKLAEYFAEFNLAELHYQAGDAQAAAPTPSETR
jgi:hypothetical protein